jgi:hypothetical protein
MPELTKEDVKQVVRDAVREAMAEKFELTLGINCTDPDERDETREDMKFLRALRKVSRTGGEKIFWGLAGLVGTGIVALFWPELSKHFPK